MIKHILRISCTCYGNDFSTTTHHWDDHVAYSLMIAWPDNGSYFV